MALHLRNQAALASPRKGPGADSQHEEHQCLIRQPPTHFRRKDDGLALPASPASSGYVRSLRLRASTRATPFLDAV